MSDNIVALAERGRPHAGLQAFEAIMGMIFEASDPDRAALMILGGIGAWLVAHRGLPEAEVVAELAAAIAMHTMRPGSS